MSTRARATTASPQHGRRGLYDARPWASFAQLPPSLKEAGTAAVPGKGGRSDDLCELLSQVLQDPPRAEEERRRRAENERRRYTKKRLAKLKERFQDLPLDVLERASLRHVSTVVRRIGHGQSVLGAFTDAESLSGLISNT